MKVKSRPSASHVPSKHPTGSLKSSSHICRPKENPAVHLMSDVRRVAKGSAPPSVDLSTSWHMVSDHTRRGARVAGTEAQRQCLAKPELSKALEGSQAAGGISKAANWPLLSHGTGNESHRIWLSKNPTFLAAPAALLFRPVPARGPKSVRLGEMGLAASASVPAGVLAERCHGTVHKYPTCYLGPMLACGSYAGRNSFPFG